MLCYFTAISGENRKYFNQYGAEMLRDSSLTKRVQ